MTSVTESPGGWSKPYKFAPPFIDKEMPASWEVEREMPECMWGITAGDSWLQEGCLPVKNPISCPMRRPLEPTREIIPDLYTLIPFPSSKALPTTLAPKDQPIVWLIIAIVLLFIVKNVVR
jgi:hypothetical protein